MKKEVAVGAGFFFTLFLINYFCAVWFGYPFLWCWGSALLRPVLLPWKELAMLVLAAIFFFALVFKGWRAAVQVGFLMFVLAALPMVAETVLRLDKSCG